MTDEELPDLGQERAAAAAGAETEGGRVGDVRGPTVTGPTASMDVVMSLEVPVTIELGRTQMAVEDVLSLGRGSVVQLDRLVGQPIEVFVSGRPFATGEVVVVGEKFGVRILHIRDAAPAAQAS